MQRNFWLVLAVLALGAAVFFVARGGSSERPFAAPPGMSGDDGDEPSPAASARVAETEDVPDVLERRELELAQDMGLVESVAELDARANLVLRGRVVDAQGRPVGGASVEPRVRRSARAMFERGPQNGFDLGTDFRTLFRDRPLAKPEVTGADGSFRFDGDAFALGTSVELAIQHRDFAPAVVRDEWTPDAGDLVLPDVVLGAGSALTGIVVGPTGAPVAAATVRFDPAVGGRGGRGGGRGPGGGAGRFGGSDNERLSELVGETQTDAAGRFQMSRVPAGSIRLLATAPRHVDGRSEAVDAAEGADVDVGEIQLGPGAELTGIVLDSTGSPVSAAEVTASVSREALIEQMRNAVDPAAGQGRQDGGRGQAFGGFAGMGSRTSSTTGADGRFVLDRVPQAPLRIEVRHPNYVDEDIEPIDPVAQTRIQVQVRPRPVASGVVVDLATGTPVELFGIRARPAPAAGGLAAMLGGGRGGRGNGVADIAQAFLGNNPELQARAQEFQAQQERQNQWRKQVVGGSGVIPGATPTPEAHDRGQFRLDDLQPGDFVFEVDAPGYVRVAAGPFTVTTESANEGFVVQVERGFALEGRVLDARTGAAVAGASVSLAIPPLDAATAGNDPMAMFGGGFRGGRGGRGPGGLGQRDVLDQTRTDRNGRFALRMLRAGTYALSVDAEGYPGLRQPAFALGGGSGTTDIRLDPGARVHGTVAGLAGGGQPRLEFTHLETNERRTANVSPDDGSYEITGLVAGGYFVRVAGNDRVNGMRDRIGAAVSSRAGAQPDLIVPAGGDIEYDVGAESLELATVQGRVFRNGEPGAGLEVRLVAQVSQTGLAPEIERFAAARLGNLWNGRVSEADGTFRIEDVPPGDYVLEVQPARGGGRGGRGNQGIAQLFGGAGNGALHSEPLTIRKGDRAERLIEVATGSLEISVTGPDGQPIGRARASLVLATEAGSTPPDQWTTLPSFVRTAVRDGALRADPVRPGSYRFAIEAEGFVTTVGDIRVVASDKPARGEARMQAGTGGGR